MSTPSLSGRLVGLAAVTILLGLSAVAVAAELPADRPAGGGRGFTISGEASGLYPGARGRLAIRVRNPFSFRIVVTSLAVTAGDTASCAGSNIRTANFHGRLLVQARSVSTVDVPIAMLEDAPPGCEGAVVPLRFRGRAVRR